MQMCIEKSSITTYATLAARVSEACLDSFDANLSEDDRTLIFHRMRATFGDEETPGKPWSPWYKKENQRRREEQRQALMKQVQAEWTPVLEAHEAIVISDLKDIQDPEIRKKLTSEWTRLKAAAVETAHQTAWEPLQVQKHYSLLLGDDMTAYLTDWNRNLHGLMSFDARKKAEKYQQNMLQG